MVTQRRPYFIAAIILLFLLASAAPRSIAGQKLTDASVIKVHDGDTVTLMVKGKMFKTRLIGIDAPEMGQRPWGRQARERLINILNHTDWIVFVETDVVKQDKYNRPLVYLWTRQHELINERMMLEGQAVLFIIPPNVKYADRFRQAEQLARQGKKGVWGPKGLKENPDRYREKHPRKQPFYPKSPQNAPGC